MSSPRGARTGPTLWEMFNEAARSSVGHQHLRAQAGGLRGGAEFDILHGRAEACAVKRNHMARVADAPWSQPSLHDSRVQLGGRACAPQSSALAFGSARSRRGGCGEGMGGVTVEWSKRSGWSGLLLTPLSRPTHMTRCGGVVGRGQAGRCVG